MRLPRSLRGRLTALAGLLVAAAIAVAAPVMGLVLHRFVTGQVDGRLDAQGLAVLSNLRPGADGRLQAPEGPDAPPFDRPHSGWVWQVETADGRRFASRSLRDEPALRVADAEAPPPPPEGRGHRPPPGPLRPVALAGEAAGLHARAARAEIAGQPVTLLVAAPPEAIAGPMGEALLPLVLSMLALGLALLGAVWLQIRLGLQPLRRLGDDLAAIRSGQARAIPLDQPDEIRPLAGELNALLAENAAGLERARRHVANLAHGLKTPLADLALTLRAPGRDPDGEALALVAALDRRVRHHLGRARAAAIGGTPRAATPLGPHLRDLQAVLSRIHADKALAFEVGVPADLAVACEPQDLDEMIGNLLDNACKWARSRIAVAARPAEHPAARMVEVTIEDDGAGLGPGEMPAAFAAGGRLDEAAPGHGFGLPIARELAELYGGGVALQRSTLGGLLVRLTLPAAADQKAANSAASA